MRCAFGNAEFDSRADVDGEPQHLECVKKI